MKGLDPNASVEFTNLEAPISEVPGNGAVLAGEQKAQQDFRERATHEMCPVFSAQAVGGRLLCLQPRGVSTLTCVGFDTGTIVVHRAVGWKTLGPSFTRYWHS
jgi:hypothetical protein